MKAWCAVSHKPRNGGDGISIHLRRLFLYITCHSGQVSSEVERRDPESSPRHSEPPFSVILNDTSRIEMNSIHSRVSEESIFDQILRYRSG